MKEKVLREQRAREFILLPHCSPVEKSQGRSGRVREHIRKEGHQLSPEGEFRAGTVVERPGDVGWKGVAFAELGRGKFLSLRN